MYKCEVGSARLTEVENSYVMEHLKWIKELNSRNIFRLRSHQIHLEMMSKTLMTTLTANENPINIEITMTKKKYHSDDIHLDSLILNLLVRNKK